MYTEFEATFTNIDKDDTRNRLKNAGAKLIRPEFMQKRVVFNLPKGHEIPGGWLRVRDEGDKITMSLKIVNGGKIDDQKETQLTVNSFDEAATILETIGCDKKAYQESKRELWELDGVEITIDEWPFLEPIVEVEGKSEEEVKNVSEKLNFDYKNARFCAVDVLYSEKYGISQDRINNHTPEILFDGENPFT
ncbi:MAG: CYTH domain-containing protein [Candidatus Woesebacteria bacterium]|nr:MAG: CYTH domain-containing protein [Candidatus Woesebacteria bacterium]